MKSYHEPGTDRVVDFTCMDCQIHANLSVPQEQVRPPAVTEEVGVVAPPALALEAHVEPLEETDIGLYEPVPTQTGQVELDVRPTVDQPEVRGGAEGDDGLVGDEGPPDDRLEPQPLHGLEVDAQVQDRRDFTQQIARRNKMGAQLHIFLYLEAPMDEESHPSGVEVLGHGRGGEGERRNHDDGAVHEIPQCDSVESRAFSP